MTKQTNERVGTGCFLLFALPFAGVGVFMTGMFFVTLVAWANMRSWQEVPARLEHVELVTIRSGDSDTKNVVVEYVYEWQGQRYQGKRVSLHTSNDSIGSFHEQTYAELTGYRNRNETFRCYVNPRNPEQAVLYRNMRIEVAGMTLAFGVVFGLLGFGLIGLAIHHRRASREQVELQQKYPEEPWHWKKEWHEGVIHSSGKLKMTGAAAFAVIWNAISIPIAIAILPEELQKGNTVALVILIFPAVGVVIIGVAVYYAMQWMRFGDSTFHLTSTPGVLGGPLHGYIRIPTELTPLNDITAEICCLRKYISGSGKNRNTHESILWETEKTIARDALRQGTRETIIPIDFHLPIDQPQTDESDPGDKHIWRLRVKAPMTGVDYAAAFEVPVFKTPQSDPAMTAAALSRLAATTIVDEEGHVITYYETDDAAQTGEKLRQAGLRLEPGVNNGIAIVFPMLRQPGVALSMLLFLVIWGGVVALLIHLDAPLLFPVIFGLLFALMFVVTLETLTGKGRVEINSAGIHAQHGPFGIGIAHQLPLDAVADIEMQRSMQVGNTLYYTVTIKQKDGGKMKIANRLRQHEAGAVINALETAVNDFL